MAASAQRQGRRTHADPPGRAAAHDVSGLPDGDRDDEPPLDIQIPDDASELAFEAEALRRERAAAARREFVLGRFRTRRYQRYGLSGPLVVVALVVVATFGALLTLLGPRSGARLVHQPLASPAIGSGSVGGLLPDAPIAVPAGTISARQLRPAVMMLVPAGCGCPEALASVLGQAREFGLPAPVVVAGDRVTPEVVRLVRSAGSAAAPLADLQGALFGAYAGGSGLAVVVVAPDGVVAGVERGVRRDQRLEPLLARATLSTPG